MASKRPPIQGEPLEVFKPRGKMASQGLVELRLYADGFELEKKRPSTVERARWVDIELLKARPVGTTKGLSIRLRKGVPASLMEKFNRKLEGTHTTLPWAFFETQDETTAKFLEYLERYGVPRQD